MLCIIFEVEDTRGFQNKKKILLLVHKSVNSSHRNDASIVDWKMSAYFCRRASSLPTWRVRSERRNRRAGEADKHERRYHFSWKNKKQYEKFCGWGEVAVRKLQVVSIEVRYKRVPEDF